MPRWHEESGSLIRPVIGCTFRYYGRVAKQLVGHVFDQHACSHAMRTRQHNLFADAAYLTSTTPGRAAPPAPEPAKPTEPSKPSKPAEPAERAGRVAAI